jgi:AAA15 family ATPase/GTPase
LDEEQLRRDQIWFVEKDLHQSTRLYPLSDFKPRKQEGLQTGYLQGRYGALPYISSPKWLK